MITLNVLSSLAKDARVPFTFCSKVVVDLIKTINYALSVALLVFTFNYNLLFAWLLSENYKRTI